MKRITYILSTIAIFIVVIFACNTKDIVLITNIDYISTIDALEEGFVRDPLETTIAVTPEVEHPDFIYFFKYEIIEGTGFFEDQEKNALPENENIALDPETSFSVSLNYKGLSAGKHQVKITTSDNFEKFQEYTLFYTLKNLDLVWTATTTITKVKPGNKVPITITLENNTPDRPVTFQRNYRFTEGSGTLSDAQGNAIVLEKLVTITPGVYTLDAVVNETGTKSITFDLIDSNGQEKSQTVTFDVTEDVLSNAADIIAISINGNNGVITGNNIDITLPPGIDRTNLAPSVIISDKATVSPASDTAQNFTNPVIYTVTAEDGSTKKYTVAVKNDGVLSSASEIIAISVNNNNGVITGNNIEINLPEGTDLSTLRPIVIVSEKATVNPASNTIQDFTDPKIYTVTAEDGSTTNYIVDVVITQIPITGIKISPKTVEEVPGKVIPLKTAVLPANASNKTINWSSSDTSIATVDGAGNVTTIKVGKVTITATSAADANIKDTAEITVSPAVIAVTSITISPKTASIELGKPSVPLTAVVVPNDASNITVNWKSDNTAIATVDANGNVTAIAVGEAVITATSASDNSITDTAIITVTPAVIAVTGITVNPKTGTEVSGKTIPLKATILPANATNKIISWTSSDTSVATVDGAGNVLTISVGNTTITATVTGTTFEDTAVITVSPVTVPVESVTLNNKTLDLNIGATPVQLIANILPINATNKIINWNSSNTAVATVDANGNVTTLAAGNTTITATAAGTILNDTASVTVTPATVPVESVTLNNKTLDLNIGATPVQLIANILPINATNKTINWNSSNTAVATVDANGNVTALAAGNTTITATAAGTILNDTANVTVKPITIKITGITVVPDDISLEEMQTTNLSVDITPTNATNKGITWTSSKTNIATVDNSGKITAIAQGSTIITATAQDGSNVSGTSLVTITPKNIPVTKIDVTPLSATIKQGVSQQLSTLVTPNNATNSAIEWTSNDSTIATVDATGKVTAIAPGSATIIATAKDGSNIQGSSTITVDPLLTGNRILTFTIPNQIGDTDFTGSKFNPNVVNIQVPSGTDVSNITPNITVSPGATYTPQGAQSFEGPTGTSGFLDYIVTAENGTQRIWRVTISKVDIPVMAISVTPSIVTLNGGETQQFTATITPSNATNKNVTWLSGNTSTATVSATGFVTAGAVGAVGITATSVADPTISGSATVQSNGFLIPVTSISVNPTTVTLLVGETRQIASTILPATATNKTVTWSSDNPGIASVSATGLITAKTRGTAIITATSDDNNAFKATTTITVMETSFDKTTGLYTGPRGGGERIEVKIEACCGGALRSQFKITTEIYRDAAFTSLITTITLNALTIDDTKIIDEFFLDTNGMVYIKAFVASGQISEGHDIFLTVKRTGEKQKVSGGGGNSGLPVPTN